MRLFLFPVWFEISWSILRVKFACEVLGAVRRYYFINSRAMAHMVKPRVNYNKLKVNVEFSITYILMKLAFVQQIFFSCKMCTKTEIGQWFCRLPISAYYSVKILQRLSISKMHTSVFNCSPKESLVLTIITFFGNWASQETFL